MARPKAKELTERELEVMHVFWDRGESTAAEVRDVLETQGRELAYTTVATLVKILHDKQFLTQTSDERPFRFQPARTYEEVSSSLLGDLVQKVFGGSRAQLLVRLFEEEKLSADEKKRLKQILDEGGRK
jgi:BlaI family penicillinase repressor